MAAVSRFGPGVDGRTALNVRGAPFAVIGRRGASPQSEGAAPPEGGAGGGGVGAGPSGEIGVRALDPACSPRDFAFGGGGGGGGGSTDDDFNENDEGGDNEEDNDPCSDSDTYWPDWVRLVGSEHEATRHLAGFDEACCPTLELALARRPRMQSGSPTQGEVAAL